MDFAVIRPTRYELFHEWARDNYSGMEFEEVVGHYLQSGDFPAEFEIEFSGCDLLWR